MRRFFANDFKAFVVLFRRYEVPMVSFRPVTNVPFKHLRRIWCNFHTRWTVNEEERISTSEALATGDLVAAEWTPYKLADFMGTMRDHRELQVS